MESGLEAQFPPLSQGEEEWVAVQNAGRGSEEEAGGGVMTLKGVREEDCVGCRRGDARLEWGSLQGGKADR